MTPRISDRALHRLTIPELSGGVNYRDGISQVLDNQLTDCKNVWYKNGVLRTRPGVRCSEKMDEEIFENDFIPGYENSKRKIYTKKENFRVIDGKTYFLVVFQYINKLVFRYYSGPGEFKKVAEITNIPREVDFSCNIFQHDSDIYCFCSGYYKNEAIPYYIYKIVDRGNLEFDEPIRITNELPEENGGFYVPTIATNMTALARSGYEPRENLLMGATMLEGHNLLGNKCKYYYSTVNKQALEIGSFSEKPNEPAHAMCYNVPLDIEARKLIPQVFKVNIRYDWGVAEHTATVVLSEYIVFSEENYNSEDNLKMEVFCNGDLAHIEFSHKDTGTWHYVTEADYMQNNMEIIVPCANFKENYEKILNMTCAEWFGGGSEGIYDGIHLFMGGNTSDKEKALVCWSDFDKPLYFSENSYAYVGDKAQRVTAFGKQGESLVVFKERETYATKYSSNTSVTNADALINQSVIDITAAEVVFPMIQVHGFIGCDCPHSVQLCRNRLVWTHSDGKVYTLVSANQYNERSIFEVSGMVERKLTAHTAEELKNALSADWEGHYILSLGDKLYLMDYNSYGYANVASYAKNEDAQIRIPWWVWDKPKYNKNTYYDAYPATDSHVESKECEIDILSMITIGGRLYVMAMFEALLAEGGSAYYPEILLFEGQDDMLPDIVLEEHGMGQYKTRELSDKEISAMVQTKLFDFGSSTIQKSVPKAEISFGNNGGLPIMVTTITDRGESVREIALNFDDADDRNPGFFKNTVIRNQEKHVNRIGYKFESEGNLFVDALSVYYKQLGGCK